MKCTSLFPCAAACFAATFTPSCVHWNTGTALRESATINTGVDVLHPVEGKVYRVGKGAGATYYMQAPEVTYTPRHRYVYFRDIFDQKHLVDPGKGIIAADVHPTGRLCWVQVEPYSKLFDLNGGKWRFEREVEGLPAGAKLVHTGDTFDYTPTALHFGTLSTRQSVWKGAKRVLSYPAEYVVDPLMWVVGNTGVVVTAAALVPVGIVGIPVAMTQMSVLEKRSDGSRPQREAVRSKSVNLRVQRRGASFAYSVPPMGLVARSKSPEGNLSAIELAEVMDKSKPYHLIIWSSLSKAECDRVVAELRAHGFNVTSMEKDHELISLSAEKQRE